MKTFSQVSRVCPSGKIRCSVPGAGVGWVVTDGGSENPLQTAFLSAQLIPSQTLNILGGNIKFELVPTMDSSSQCTTSTACINLIHDPPAMQALNLTCTGLTQVSSSTVVDIKGLFTVHLLVTT